VDQNNKNNSYNEDVGAQTSEDAFEQDPVLVQYQTSDEQERWLSELDAARQERKDFDERGVKTVQRYRDQRDKNTQGVSRYNLFFTNTETKRAALYANTPKPVIKRAYDDASDDVARVASYILERNISYELRKANFDTSFRQSVFDRIVPGMGVQWARFEQEEGEPEYQTAVDPLTQTPVQQAIPGSEIKNQFACLDYVAWDDFLSAPCQVWTDCRWVGRRVSMTKDSVGDRFGDTCPPEVLKALSYGASSSETQGSKNNNTNSLKPKHVVEKTIDVYELWDKESQFVYWICEQASVPLDVQQDTNNFSGFFPTPLPPLGRFDTSSTKAISDYSQTQYLYNELDKLVDRLSGVSDSF